MGFLFKNHAKRGGEISGKIGKTLWAGALAGLVFCGAVLGLVPSGAEGSKCENLGTGVQVQIAPRADDKVFYTTSTGVAVKKQNSTLYTTLGGQVYAVLGQGDGSSTFYVDGYIQKEYIEGTGTQYINTGVATANDLEWVLVGNFTSYTSSYNSQMGSYYNNYRQYLCSLADSGTKFCYGLSYNDHTRIMTGDYNTHTWKYQNGVYYIDDNSWTKSLVTSGSYNWFLFACNGAGSVGSYCWFRMQSCKIWKSDVLIRDFVPVQCPCKKSIGLYDKVNKVLYENQGTGNFLVGGNVVPEEVLNAQVYDNFSYASGALEEDLAFRTVEGVEYVGGVERGYLLCQNQSDGGYMKLRI